jgi:hypothetical protein
MIIKAVEIRDAVAFMPAIGLDGAGILFLANTRARARDDVQMRGELREEINSRARPGGQPGNKGGRPPKLVADQKTIGIIEGLGKILSTHIEAAAVLGVSKPTFEQFLARNKKAEEAFEKGKSAGKISLRRAQFKAALDGNATMLVWLGKQLLGQKDKHEHGGTAGGPTKLQFVKADEALWREAAQ